MFEAQVVFYKEQHEYVVNVYKDGVHQELHYFKSPVEVASLLEELEGRMDV